MIAITAGLHDDVIVAIRVKHLATRSQLSLDPISWALPDYLLGKISQVQSIRMASYDFLERAEIVSNCSSEGQGARGKLPRPHHCKG
jgi:hypothetical protein